MMVWSPNKGLSSSQDFTSVHCRSVFLLLGGSIWSEVFDLGRPRGEMEEGGNLELPGDLAVNPLLLM